MKEFEGNELDSTCGISDEELTKRFIRGVEIEIEKMKAKGLPIARYERETGRVYFEYPDGRKEYLNIVVESEIQEVIGEMKNFVRATGFKKKIPVSRIAFSLEEAMLMKKRKR